MSTVTANDALGNPIVMGREYVCVFYGTQSHNNFKTYGIAVKYLEGKRGIKVTLAVTKAEEYGWGELERTQEHNKDVDPLLSSFHPAFLFPV